MSELFGRRLSCIAVAGGLLLSGGCSDLSYYDLKKAISAGNTNVISGFVEEHGSIDAQVSLPHHEGTETLLHLASREGHLEFVRALLDQGADVNATNSFGGSALVTLICEGEDEARQNVFKFLLQHHIGVSAKSRDGWNALMWASKLGRGKYMALLLHSGADPRSHDTALNTPLHLAQTADVAVLLVKAGAHVNSTNIRGETPLDAAEFRSNLDAAHELQKLGGTNGNSLAPVLKSKH